MRRHAPPAPLLLVFSLAVAGCARDPFAAAQRSIDDGSARAALQAKLDATRQCASALSGLDPPSYDLTPSFASIRALSSAGLIAPAPAEAGRRTYRPTAIGRRDFVYTVPPEGGGRTFVTLCYGRRHAGRVWLRPHGRTDPLPYLDYSYRIDEAPAWTARADIRAAFPFLRMVFGREWTDDDSNVFFDTGRWRFDELDPRILGSPIENSFMDLEGRDHGR